MPGDLRIEWRVALITLMLGYSRSKQASIAKLHILNDAIRSGRSSGLLDLLVGAKPGMLPWVLRVEPAFARAIDFVVGDKLAVWTPASGGRTSLKLSNTGIQAFESLEAATDILGSEKEIIAVYARKITEASVANVIGPERRGS